MALTPEWRGRIEQWRDALQKLIYEELAPVPLAGFITREQLSPAQALKRSFRPMPAGTPWGAKWEYAWFRGRIRLPAAAQGHRIVFHTEAASGGFTVNPASEGRVLVNGREAGGRDWAHPDITLAPAGAPGAVYDVLIEAYAGHGPTECGGGPALHGRPTVPEPPPTQRTVFPASVGIWHEELYQAWLDVVTLLGVRDTVDADSLRVAHSDEALRQFTLRADLSAPLPQVVASVRAARAVLRPPLRARNGSTAPLFHCFGHSHIDVAWLWPLAETERKCARTFATQLALMEEYPEYRFFQSQPHLYDMTRRLYPQLYARIKAAARRGQWIPEGGMWVEADTNITGGESLVRQFIHGKRFFREEFGVDCSLMWLPDVFGYSGALPQIMAGCGIHSFSTQKIFWTYNGGEPFPYNSFWWEGIDGTRILSHIHNDYNSPTDPGTLIRRWKQRVQKDEISCRLVPFGWGDGGGGPTRTHLEFLRRQRDLQGAPRCVMASPSEFFRRERREAARLPVYVGELYFQAHRGTYTTQARTKRGNRRCEFALREAELWGAAATALAARPYAAARLDEAWKGVLLNQFHDIIPGSSIRRVYDEAEALHARVLKTAEREAADAARALALPRARRVAVFNSLSWERTALVALPAGMRGAESGGTPLPAQRIGDATYVEVRVPPCGWTTLAPARPATVLGGIRASPGSIENEHFRATVNERGEIASLVDKVTGRNLAAGPLNAFRLYKDTPRAYEAWDVDSTYKLQPVALPGRAQIEVLADGPLAAGLLVRRTIHDSTIEQVIWLRRHSRRIEFRTRIDWRERQKLLKVCFPTAVHANEAIHEIQFGHLRRPNHASRPFDADRFEVCNQKWTALAEENRGVAVLNDCKYGVSVEGGSIDLTLLRATQAPDMAADQGLHEFTYAVHAWNGSFFESDVVREAYELNAPVQLARGDAGDRSILAVDAPNVIVEAVKPAEDGSGDLVVRLYEAKRAATSCVLSLGIPIRRAWAADMLETRGRELRLHAGAIELDFRPFEIKTLRLKSVQKQRKGN